MLCHLFTKLPCRPWWLGRIEHCIIIIWFGFWLSTAGECIWFLINNWFIISAMSLVRSGIHVVVWPDLAFPIEITILWVIRAAGIPGVSCIFLTETTFFILSLIMMIWLSVLCVFHYSKCFLCRIVWVHLLISELSSSELLGTRVVGGAPGRTKDPLLVLSLIMHALFGDILIGGLIIHLRHARWLSIQEWLRMRRLKWIGFSLRYETLLDNLVWLINEFSKGLRVVGSTWVGWVDGVCRSLATKEATCDRLPLSWNPLGLARWSIHGMRRLVSRTPYRIGRRSSLANLISWSSIILDFWPHQFAWIWSDYIDYKFDK